MTSKLPTLLVVYGKGALSPLDIYYASAEICEPVFVLPSGSIIDDDMRTLLGELAEVAAPDVTRLKRRRPEGIVTFSDSCLRPTAELAARLGLRYHSVRTAEMLTSKIRQRRAFNAAGVTPTRFVEINSTTGKEKVEASVEEVGLPCVIKPSQGSGSQHAYLVEGHGQAWEVIRSLRAAGIEIVIVEEHLGGAPTESGPYWADIVSVETLFANGTAHHVTTTGRFPFAKPFRASGSFMPSLLDPASVDTLYALAEQASRALGVTDGFVHTEFKLTADGPRVIEINGRLGGFISWLLRRSRGLDAAAAAMRASLGMPFDLTSSPSGQVAFQRLVVPPMDATRVERLDSSAVREIPGVEAVQVWKRTGDHVDWTHGTDACLALVSGAVEDHEALGPLLASVARDFSVDYS